MTDEPPARATDWRGNPWNPEIDNSSLISRTHRILRTSTDPAHDRSLFSWLSIGRFEYRPLYLCHKGDLSSKSRDAHAHFSNDFRTSLSQLEIDIKLSKVINQRDTLWTLPEPLHNRLTLGTPAGLTLVWLVYPGVLPVARS